MKASGVLKRIWHWLRWPVYVLAGLYVAAIIWDIWYRSNEANTESVVAAIHAQKITLADVEGKNLPPIPDQAENDATVAGIDKNNNGIRDDVELAIFKKYPNSAKIRAAELQYAMAIQLMLTKVFNTGTWIAAAEETSRGDSCVGLTDENFGIYLARTREVESLVVNTQKRKDAEDSAYNFTTSFSLPNTDICNVDLNALSN